MNEPPRPVSDIDTQLRKSLGEAHRFRWYLVGAIFALLIASTGMLGYTVLRQQSEIRASCEFWSALAPLPVTAAPPAKVPSKISVTVIAGSRQAAEGLGCGHILPAAPSLRYWASYYHVRVP